MHFVMDESFSLGDLMRLGLHQYVDACNEIVDKAEKELTIENALRKIEDTWSNLALAFTRYQVHLQSRHYVKTKGLPSTQTTCNSAHAVVISPPHDFKVLKLMN